MKALIKLFTVLALLISVSAQASEKIYFVQSDHLGTPEILTDENQNIVWRAGKDPFGDATPTVEQITFNIRFHDLETGLHYNWNRYYDPQTGRYITSDLIGLRGGLNTYGYVYGNPLRWTDILGLQVDINYVDSTSQDPLRGRLNRVTPPEGSLSVGGHGNNEAIQDRRSGLGWAMPTDVASKLRDLPNYSPDKPVYLYVCDAGEGEDSFAQQLSDLLGGQPVYARPDTVYINSDGSKVTPPLSEWIEYK